MKKTAIILLAAFGIAKAQLKVQTNGAVTIPFGNSYWIGTPADAGNRVRLHHSGTDSYFDFFPNLRFRSGANASYETMILNTNGNLGIYGSVFSFMYSGGYKFASIEGRDYGNYNGAIHFNIARSNSPTTTLYNVFKVDYQGNSFLYGNAYSQQYWMWSDKKLKTNIKTCSNALTKVLSMRGVDYTPVDSMEVLEIVQPIQTQVATDSSSKSISQKSISTSKPEFKKVNKPYGVNNKNKDQIGFIAQELELIVPQAVKTDENGLKAVNYMAVIPLLVEAIKELNTKNGNYSGLIIKRL